MEKKRDNRAGFTLLELILYLLIFAAIATLGGTVLNFSLEGKGVVGKYSEVQTAVDRVAAQMIEKVHQSVRVIDASTTLNLEMASSTINPTIFALSGGAITTKEGSAAAVSTTPAAIFVSSLNFTKIDNPAPSTSSVRIKITAGYNASGTAEADSLYSVQTTALPL